MASSKSIDQFRRALQQRYHEFDQQFRRLIVVFAKQSKVNDRPSVVDSTRKAAIDLHDYLATDDRPQWIAIFIETAGRYLANHSKDDEAAIFLESVIELKPTIGPIVVEDKAPVTINFDAIYERCRDANRIPELFDEIIRVAKQIIDSGSVDSVTVLEALEQIVQILKSNRLGSFLAVKQSYFLVRYIKNLIIGGLKEIQPIKVLVEAFDKTIEEGTTPLDRLEVDIKVAMSEEMAGRFPRIKRLPNFKEQFTDDMPQLLSVDRVKAQLQIEILPPRNG